MGFADDLSGNASCFVTLAKQIVDESGGFGAAIIGLHVPAGSLDVAADHWIDLHLLERLTELLIRP